MPRRNGRGDGWGGREKTERARALRRAMTPAETVLWGVLRRSTLGARARRQHPILGWIVDFYVPSAKLVIEVDGPAHAWNEGADAYRADAMKSAGLKVLRVSNEAVLTRLSDVLETIRAEANLNPWGQHTPSISEGWGEGAPEGARNRRKNRRFWVGTGRAMGVGTTNGGAPMRVEHAACSHVGRRSNNEDSFCVAPELGLFVVADGMGGYEGGEVASRLAVETLCGFYRRNADDDNATWPFGLEAEKSLAENMLSVGIRLADAEVNARRTGRLSSMGSTLAAIAVDGSKVVVGHVGDSRVYRLRGGAITQVTRDHSLHEDMIAAGMAVPPKDKFPHANVITRALGMKGTVKADLRTLEARAGDVFLLCTDGLVETVKDARIREVLLAQAPASAAEALVREAYEQGGRDNITVVIARVVG